MAEPPQLGRIVWAEIADANGLPKWVARMRHTDIRESAGVVPGAIMLEILSKVTAPPAPPSDPPAAAGGRSSAGSSI